MPARRFVSEYALCALYRIVILILAVAYDVGADG